MGIKTVIFFRRQRDLISLIKPWHNYALKFDLYFSLFSIRLKQMPFRYKTIELLMGLFTGHAMYWGHIEDRKKNKHILQTTAFIDTNCSDIIFLFDLTAFSCNGGFISGP